MLLEYRACVSLRCVGAGIALPFAKADTLLRVPHVSRPQQFLEIAVDFRAALCRMLFWGVSKIHICSGFRLQPESYKLLRQQGQGGAVILVVGNELVFQRTDVRAFPLTTPHDGLKA